MSRLDFVNKSSSLVECEIALCNATENSYCETKRLEENVFGQLG